MRIATIGRGKIGGGLAKLWQQAGYELTTKSFNVNFAALFDRIGEASSAPGNLWCGDEEAREVTERLIRDAGYEPICAGPLANAAMQEQVLGLIFAIAKEGGTGQFYYRMAPPGKL
ncbi:MAG: hypothetical protein ACOYD4_13055 [Solirubrobacterales bacterium]